MTGSDESGNNEAAAGRDAAGQELLVEPLADEDHLTLARLALVPFAGDGVLWFRDAVATIWDSVTT